MGVGIFLDTRECGTMGDYIKKGAPEPSLKILYPDKYI